MIKWIPNLDTNQKKMSRTKKTNTQLKTDKSNTNLIQIYQKKVQLECFLVIVFVSSHSKFSCAEIIIIKSLSLLELKKKFYKISWYSTQKREMTLNGVCNKGERVSLMKIFVYLLHCSLHKNFNYKFLQKKIQVASFLYIFF